MINVAVRSSRQWGWWGIAFVVAFVASIPAGNALTVGKSLYLPGASAAELRDFYTGSGTAVLVQSALQTLAAFALYRFGRGVGAALQRAGDRGRAVLAMAAGTAAATGFLFLSVVFSLVLVVSAKSAGDGIVAGLGKAALLSGGALHLIGLALLVSASSVVALRSGTRTRWVFHYGRIVGPLLVMSVISIGSPPLMKIEPLWRLLAIVWIVGVAVAVLRGRIGNGQAARPTHAVGVEA
jgi:hypothetical protein